MHEKSQVILSSFARSIAKKQKAKENVSKVLAARQ